MVTSDESGKDENAESETSDHDELDERRENFPEKKEIENRHFRRLRNRATASQNDTISPRDVVKLIKKFNSQDEMGIEPFIALDNRIKMQCRNSKVLLDWIIAEKIEGEAEKSIRFLSIQSYSDLFKSLRINFGTTGFLEPYHTKLSLIVQ